MLTRIIIAFFLVLSVPAWGQFSKPVMQSQINSQFPDQNTGQVTPATTRAFMNNLLASYQQYTGLNKQVGTSYNIATSDYGQLVTFTSGSTVSVGLSQANTTGYNPFNVYVQNLSTGNVVITPSGSTICGASSLTLTNQQVEWIISDGTNYQCIAYLNSQVSLNAPANTFYGNPTSASAARTDTTVPSCSSTGCALQWTNGTGFTTASNVATFNSRTGTVTPASGDYTLNQIFNCTLNPQGRLTFATQQPVMTTSNSGATSHFYTPYLGQQVPLFDGTRFNCTDTGGELSQAATDATKSPAAVGASSCYDVFIWSDSGTVRATRGPAWTSVTARSAGTALTRSNVNGILLNNATITNGPAALRGTYVGTECSNAGSTFDWTLGAAASGGTAASLNVWNMYNRVDVTTNVTDNGVAYAGINGTTRQARASAGNQITFVSGLGEDGITVAYAGACASGTTAGDGCAWGYGLDSTSTFGSQPTGFATATAVSTTFEQVGTWMIVPQLGRHVLSANEQQLGAVANSTFDNSSLNQFSFYFKM